jgi:hypothetical protein
MNNATSGVHTTVSKVTMVLQSPRNEGFGESFLCILLICPWQCPGRMLTRICLLTLTRGEILMPAVYKFFWKSLNSQCNHFKFINILKSWNICLRSFSDQSQGCLTVYMPLKLRGNNGSAADSALRSAVRFSCCCCRPKRAPPATLPKRPIFFSFSMFIINSSALRHVQTGC